MSKEYMIPLVIGVTGHRDIPNEDIPFLKEKVEELFSTLEKKYPTTPFILLSPLADGADRVVVEVALAKFKDKITIKLPFPFDEDLYIDTLGKGISKANEEELIEKSKSEYKILKSKVEKDNESIEIKLGFDRDLYNLINQSEIDNTFYEKHIIGSSIIPKEYDEFIEKFEKNNKRIKYKNIKNENNEDLLTKNEYLQKLLKREGYALVGEYVAIHSHILIALENPKSKGGVGGTSEIVEKKLNGEYEILTKQSDVSQPEQGIVYQVNTPRLKDDKEQKLLDEEKYKFKKLFPNTQEVKEPKDIFKRFNFTDLKKHLFSKPCLTFTQEKKLNPFRQQHMRIECLNKMIKNNLNKIKIDAEEDIKDFEEKSNKKESNENILRLIEIRRAIATISRSSQDKMNKMQKWLLGLILLTTMIISTKSIYSKLISESLNIIYPLIIALFYILITHFKNHKSIYEDTRAISEGIRVQIAWSIVHIKESVALNYLSRQKDELNWIRSSLRVLSIFSSNEKTEVLKEDLKTVESYWIDKQIGFFESRIKEYTHIEECRNSTINILLVCFVCLSLFFSFNNFFKFYGISAQIQTIALSIPLVLLAYYKTKQLFDGYEKIIKQYELSLDSFRRAKKLLSHNDNYTEHREVIKSLGKEALFENSYWTILRREKEFKAPSL